MMLKSKEEYKYPGQDQKKAIGMAMSKAKKSKMDKMRSEMGKMNKTEMAEHMASCKK